MKNNNQDKLRFCVGEKVAAYNNAKNYRGTVVEINGNILVLNIEKDNLYRYDFHVKQCRKLKKKARRRVWIFTKNLIEEKRGYVNAYVGEPTDPSLWTEFVEVKK